MPDFHTLTSTAQFNSIQKDHIHGALSDRLEAYKQLQSGKKFEKPSDDPIAWHEADMIRADMGKFRTFSYGVREALGSVGDSISNIDEIRKELESAVTKAQMGSNSTMSQESRHVLASEIETIQRSIVAFGNRADRHGDYLFAGKATTSDSITKNVNELEAAIPMGNNNPYAGLNDKTKPFALNGNELVYLGTSDTRTFRVGPGNDYEAFTAVPATGDSLVKAYNNLEELKNNLRNGNVDLIAESHEKLQKDAKTFRSIKYAIGDNGEELSNLKEQYDSLLYKKESDLSDTEDVNSAEAVMKFRESGEALQRAYTSTAAMNKFNLLDFINGS